MKIDDLGTSASLPADLGTSAGLTSVNDRTADLRTSSSLLTLVPKESPWDKFSFVERSEVRADVDLGTSVGLTSVNVEVLTYERHRCTLTLVPKESPWDKCRPRAVRRRCSQLWRKRPEL